MLRDTTTPNTTPSNDAFLHLAGYVKDFVAEVLDVVTTFAADNNAVHHL